MFAWITVILKDNQTKELEEVKNFIVGSFAANIFVVVQ